ncbi:MAG: Sjogren's syndrome/scleroderma autoantigen 1 family protein [Methanomicrobiales archaeon]
MAGNAPDEVMGEYLLKGGKMLAKTCPDCGSPLFEYKGRTFCVICEEKGEQPPAAKRPETGAPREPVPERDTPPATSPEAQTALEETIVHLCDRIQQERDPDDCRALAEAAFNAARARRCLDQR